MKDIIGQKFGKLFVIEEVSRGRRMGISTGGFVVNVIVGVL